MGQDIQPQSRTPNVLHLQYRPYTPKISELLKPQDAGVKISKYERIFSIQTITAIDSSFYNK